MSTVIKVENLSKQYRLGNVGTGSIAHDVNRAWYRIRGKEDPYLKIGEENDRSKKGSSEEARGEEKSGRAEACREESGESSRQGAGADGSSAGFRPGRVAFSDEQPGELAIAMPAVWLPPRRPPLPDRRHWLQHPVVA